MGLGLGLGSLNGYESGLAASIGTNAALIATGDGVGWWLVSWLPGHSARGGVPSLLDTGSAGKGLRKMERIEHFDASSRSILSEKLNSLECGEFRWRPSAKTVPKLVRF